MSGWYKQGNDVKSEDFNNSNQINRNLPEFWLMEGKENGRQLLFLDDPKFFLNRITLKTVESDYKTFTSPGDEDPAIAMGHRPTGCLAFTVLDLTPFKDKKGNDRKYSKKLFLARGKACVEALDERRSNSGGSLVGLKIKVMRLGDKSSRSGNDFQVLGRTDLSKLNIPAEDLKPFDYMEMLAPPTIPQIAAVLKYAAAPNGSKKKSKTVSRESLDSADPFPTDSDNYGAGIGGVSDLGPEPSFASSDDIPF